MVESSSILATWLDHHMLLDRQISIADPGTPIDTLPLKTGQDVYEELGGRYFIRYIVPAQVGRFSHGDEGKHYVCPTPYTPSETLSWLVLPAGAEPRTHALLLDPRRIASVRGPQWVGLPGGIQYVLPNGFPQDAIVVPGTPGAAWEIVVH